MFENLHSVTIGKANNQPSHFIIIGENAKPLVTFTNDGRVTFGEGYTPDKAARVFWHSMASRNPLRVFPDCGLAFAEEMEGRQYGSQETANARAWFEDGWNAALLRDADDAARYRTIRAAVAGDDPVAVAHFMASDNPTSADEMDALVDAARGLPL